MINLFHHKKFNLFFTFSTKNCFSVTKNNLKNNLINYRFKE